jgi:murein DD-endopeptidase / murein LD-carboxypeptidase
MRAKSGRGVARAAQTLVGSPFRLHGRDAGTGLDCIGLVGLAAGIEALPEGYTMRSGTPLRVLEGLSDAGFRRRWADTSKIGDIIVFRPGPGQFHFAIRTPDGFVHADARRGKVVETPGLPEWPIEGIWHISTRTL